MRNKEKLEQRWRSVYDDFKESVQREKKDYMGPWTNCGLDNQYFCTSSWSGHLETIGTLSYLLDHDIDVFKNYLSESTKVCQELFEHYERGNVSDAFGLDYVDITGYAELFQALAAGDMKVAKHFAHYLGGRPEIEDEYNTDFDVYLGYTLKSFVEKDSKGIQKHLPLLAEHCKAGRFATFQGYVTVFEAILAMDVDKANEGFKALLIGHDKEWKGRGERYFKGGPQEDICIWGLGLANLCFYYGLPVSIDHPLIPKDLLFPELLAGTEGSSDSAVTNVFRMSEYRETKGGS